MFNNEDDLKETISRLNIDDKPNPAHRESLREQVLSVFDKTGEQPISQSRPLWRTIMKSPIGKLAAAAVIIVAVLIGIHQFGNSVDVTTVALAQVREAMGKVNWLRCTVTGPGDLTEQWYSFASKIEVCKERSGKVTYYDYGENRKYFYEHGNNTITVSHIAGDGFAMSTASPLEFLEKIIQKRKNEGTEVICKAGQYNGTKVEIWELMRSEENGVENIKVFINMKNHLPIAAEVKYTDLNGKIGYEGKAKYEYPKNGPTDIYTLGVPQTAKIIDTREVAVAGAENEPKLVATPKPTISPELAALDIKLPRPMFVGTPQDIKVDKLEKPLGKPRPPFFAPVGTKNAAFGKRVSSTDEEPIIGEIEMITDGDKEGSDGSYVELGPFKQHVTIDLGAEHDIYAIVVWHFHKNPCVYFDVVVQISSEPNFVKPKTVFNNDIDNSLKFGAGKNMHYVDTNEGKLIDAKGTRGRYVRLYSQGNTQNDLNHYIEVEVYGKAANDKAESIPDEKKDQRKDDKGDIENADPNTPKSGMAPLQIELPTPLFIGTPQNVQVPYLKKPTGKPRPLFYAPVGTKNVAFEKPVTSTDEEPIIGETELITDGDKEGADGSFIELGPFPQSITIDLEAVCDIYAIVAWHYHKEAWVYFDVVVQVADDPDFITNVRTLFNNDIDNSLGQGVGKNMHYTETAEGKLIDAKGVQARYVRLHSNGSTGSDANHYIEVEVYGKAAK